MHLAPDLVPRPRPALKFSSSLVPFEAHHDHLTCRAFSAVLDLSFQALSHFTQLLLTRGYRMGKRTGRCTA